MADGFEEHIADLDREIAALETHGVAPVRVVQLGREILRLTAAREWAGAERAYGEMLAYAAAHGDAAAHALARYGQGVALFRIQDRRDEARAAFQEAASLAITAGHRSLASKAYHILAALTLEAGDVPAAAQLQAQALEHLDEALDPLLAAQVYRNRANMHCLLGELEKARTDLDRARLAAQRAKDHGLELGIEVDRQVVDALAGPGTTALGLLDALYGQAQAAGRRDILGDVALHQAIVAHRIGDLSQAQERAHLARRHALRSNHPARYLRYLSACLLVAVIREQKGDRPGVLAILLTCKGTLEKAAGKRAGLLARVFLDALQERWGAEGLQAALAAYRRRFREAQPGQQTQAQPGQTRQGQTRQGQADTSQQDQAGQADARGGETQTETQP